MPSKPKPNSRTPKTKPKPATGQGRRGRPNAVSIRWNLKQAAMEFGWDTTNLERARRSAGVNAGEDGLFSTRQIAKIVFGDKEAEVIAKLQSERRALDLKHAQQSAELIPTVAVVKLGEKIIIPIRQRIMSSNLPDVEKRDLLADLEKLGEIDWAKEVARA